MKKFIFILTLIIFLSIFLYTPKTFALEKRYMKVCDENTIFYINDNFLAQDELFSIPKGYYIEILKEYESYFEVSYGENSKDSLPLYGFIKKSSYLKENTQEDIFPCFLELEIAPKKDTKLYSMADRKSNIKYGITINQSVRYLGARTNNNEIFFFVQLGNTFGYVEKEAFPTFNIPEHKIPIEEKKEIKPSDAELDTVPQEKETEPSKKDNENISGSIKKWLVVLITIPAILIVLIIFYPNKRKRL